MVWCKQANSANPVNKANRLGADSGPNSFNLRRFLRGFFARESFRDSARMNPMNGPSGPTPIWQEARNADGRAYYYNVQTKATQWAKPVELMTPVEVREDSRVCIGCRVD